MPDKAFLEQYPLYKKLEGFFGFSLSEIPKPAIVMQCGNCESAQTFNMANQYFEFPAEAASDIKGRILRAVYLCRGCERFRYVFVLRMHTDEDAVSKVGQYPPWSIAVPRSIAKSLGTHADEYQKGLICESQGYGIGAFAYYRRIVEQAIDGLLAEIESIVPPADQATYAAALSKAKATRVAQEKIEIVKELLPQSLRPDGLNPLAVLHEVLSEGLHAESDERCLALAASVREVLSFLISQVLSTKASQKTFSDNIRRLLDRKSAG